MKLLLEQWRGYLKESLANDLTDKMHSQWLKNYQAENGDTPRLKPIPDNPSIEQLERYGGIEMVDGVAHQNINQEANGIVPSLKHKLNGAPAVDYAAAIEKNPIKTTDDIERLASIFHEVWMKHNSWQKDSNPSLFADYSQLPADEKLKDLVQLKVGLDLQYAGDKQVQQLFSAVVESTK
jgi:hypothetical protein|tara:strand:- start:180 stop:719 length:540 start_codon:yes stop_codon:yes gene_type:complete